MKLPKLYRSFYIVLEDVDYPCAGVDGFGYSHTKHLVKVRRVRCDFKQGWKLQFVPPKNFTDWDYKFHYLTEWCKEAFNFESDYSDCCYLDLPSYEVIKSSNYDGCAINFYI